jgi:hypothetical protein
MVRGLSLLALLLVPACAEEGDASCAMREHIDDHDLFSCSEAAELAADEYEDWQHACEQIPGRENYVAAKFSGSLCSRAHIAGGCDLGGGRRLWYYPNAQGYPSAADMEVLCGVQGFESLPPP